MCEKKRQSLLKTHYGSVQIREKGIWVRLHGGFFFFLGEIDRLKTMMGKSVGLRKKLFYENFWGQWHYNTRKSERNEYVTERKKRKKKKLKVQTSLFIGGHTKKPPLLCSYFVFFIFLFLCVAVVVVGQKP